MIKELQEQHGMAQDTLRMAKDSLTQVLDFLQIIENAKEVSGTRLKSRRRISFWGQGWADARLTE